MNLFKLIFLPILISFQGNCTSSVKNQNALVPQVNSYDTQDDKVGERQTQDKFEKLRIAKKTVKRNSNNLGLKDLKEKAIASSDLEIRIWSDQETLLHCLIISKNGNNWKSSFITGEFRGEKLTKKESQKNLAPKSGWKSLSDVFVSKNIDFPFTYEIDNSDAVLEPDEGTLVLEIKKGENYGIVFYRKFSDTKDGKTIIELCKFLQDEFNLDLGCR